MRKQNSKKQNADRLVGTRHTYIHTYRYLKMSDEQIYEKKWGFYKSRCKNWRKVRRIMIKNSRKIFLLEEIKQIRVNKTYKNIVKLKIFFFHKRSKNCV